MGLTAKQKGNDIDPIPAGFYPAICVGVYDLGNQYSEWYKKTTHKVTIVWEVPGQRIDLEIDGKMENLPRHISNRYTVSLGKKSNLRKMLVGWRGKQFTDDELEGFDLKNILSINCQIQIIHDDNGYANVENVLPASKPGKIKSESILGFFSFEEMDWTHPFEKPDEMPNWIYETIQKSEEWKTGGKMDQAAQEVVPAGELMPPADEEDDDLPF